jgi:ABC-type antimicrobial peptide transport system permease subunit
MAEIKYQGIGVGGLLGVAFIVLKLCEVIKWPWIWVLSPFWMPLALVLAIIIIVVIFTLIITRIQITQKKRREKKEEETNGD